MDGDMSCKSRISIRFNFDHGDTPKTLIAGHPKKEDNSFELADRLIKELIDTNGKDKVRRRVCIVDVFCVICDQHTNNTTEVSAEVENAQE